jgi:hypothetical protein
VVFDDSDFALAQGYPVSMQQAHTKHRQLKNRDSFMAPALKELPLSLASEQHVLKTTTKLWDRCTQ